MYNSPKPGFIKTFLLLASFLVTGTAMVQFWNIAPMEKEEEFEFFQAPGNVIYVDAAATGSEDGTSWTDAYNDLQDALQSALACDTVKVATGTYFPDRQSGDRDSSFHLPDSVVLLGGYEGILGDNPDERNWTCNPTILSGDISGDPGEDSYHVLTTINVGTATLVDGFIIRDGYADGEEDSTSRGGGWYNVADNGGVSSPLIQNCVFESNSAIYGGGFANFADTGTASPTFLNTIFRGNSSEDGGAAIYSINSGGVTSMLLTNSILSGNFTLSRGSAVVLQAAMDTVFFTLVNSVCAVKLKN